MGTTENLAKFVVEHKEAVAGIAYSQPTEETATAVSKLSDHTFDEKTHEGAWFVCFGRSSKGHIADLTGTLDDLADSVSNVRFGIVDCDYSSATCEEHGIDKVPAQNLYFGTRVFNYDGRMDQKSVKDFVK